MNARAHHDRECQQLADQWRDAARVLAVIVAEAVTTSSPTVEMSAGEILRRLGAEHGARYGSTWLGVQIDGIDHALATLADADLVTIVRASEGAHKPWIIEIVQ